VHSIASLFLIHYIIYSAFGKCYFLKKCKLIGKYVGIIIP
jgi:hypothetical protein